MLKCLVRYFVGHVRLVQGISEQRRVKTPRVDTDSDYAGCVLARTITTCAHFFHGVNLLKAGSWTQGTRSLSAALGVLRRSQRRIDFAGREKHDD